MADSVQDALGLLEAEIESACQAFGRELGRLRTGRAHVGLLDNVRVSFYGTLTPLSQCASLNATDPRMLTVKPWDRGLVGEIERAILASSLGITPQNDGETIRLPIPPLTEERRKDLVRQAKMKGEDAKIGLRNHRRDANEMLKSLEKDKAISQDDLKRAVARVQDLTDAGAKRCEGLLAAKEKEILAI